MYLESKWFRYKISPMDQARVQKGHKRRKTSEDLNLKFTAKDKKLGAMNPNFMVGICYEKRVI